MHRRALLSGDWADLKNNSPSRKPHVSKGPFSKRLALSPSGSFDDLRFESGSSSWHTKAEDARHLCTCSIFLEAGA